jgi:intracellular multiplication protein IcmJ
MAKALLPLVLSVKAANWRMDDRDSESADAEFKHQRLKALERDDRTCRFCGFRAPKYQEIHHFNDDHHDNRVENLITACPFCHAVQHIGLAGKSKKAVLAWIPEIPQDRLHHVMRSIYLVCHWAQGVEKDRRLRVEVVRAAAEQAQAAKSLESKLLARTAEAEKRFVTSDALELGDILHQMANNSPALYERRADFLQGLRLLPLSKWMEGGKDKMPDMIDSWQGTGGPYANLNPRAWMSVLANSGVR